MAMLNSEVTIKHMKLRNRLVLPPITTNYGSPEGFVTEDILCFYKERSKDIGLTIVEATSVHSGGCIVPNSLGLWEDSQIPGMSKQTCTSHTETRGSGRYPIKPCRAPMFSARK